MSSYCPTEHEEQVLFLGLFELAYPGVRILALANGGLRNKKVAFNLKTEGVRPGVPDLLIPAWNTWVEMKRQRGGKLSPEQKDWIEYLQSIGHTAIVAKGADDGMTQLAALGRTPVDALAYLFN